MTIELKLRLSSKVGISSVKSHCLGVTLSSSNEKLTVLVEKPSLTLKRIGHFGDLVFFG